MNSRSSHQKGMSLVEILIALGLGAICISVISNYFQLSFKTSRYVRALSIQNDLVAEVKMALNSEVSCRKNFSSKRISAGTKLRVPVFPVDSGGNLMPNPIVAAGLKVQDVIQINDVFLSEKLSLPNNEQLLTLTIEWEKLGGILGPSSSGSSVIPMLAKIDATGAIVSCRSNFQYNGITNVEDEVCRLQSGGAMMYDPNTKQCVSALTCFNGSPSSATCGGTNMSPVSCNAFGYSLIGTAPTINRGYKGYGKQLGGPPDYLTQLTSNGCTCIYADEVDENNGTTYCQVCCKGP